MTRGLLRRSAAAAAMCASVALAGVWSVPGTAASAAAAAPAAVAAGCPAPAVGQVSCGALMAPGTGAVASSALRQRAATSAAAAAPAGFTPLDLRSAYGLTASALTGGVGQTVAVVTAFDDVSAESDLGTYRSQYHLPACTTANGCFTKVDQNGGTAYPPAGPAGWPLAAAQSLDMISAACPNCHILLVEANSTAITDLGPAENEAVSLGAKFVTSTWLTPEATYATSEPGFDSSYFTHPGVVMTAPDGNGAGFGTYYPAASPDVIAVGGTTLTKSGSGARHWAETAWDGTGSGCSPYEAKPAWQADTACASRTLNDVAAVADASGSPIAFFDTASGGWVASGGGDAASALVAAAFALAGTPAAGSSPASYLYAHDGAHLVNDIASGSDGTCAPAALCTAGTGYDGPTGVGSIESAFALGAHAPGDIMPGAPASVDPVSGSLDLFGTGNQNGTAWDDIRTGGSWSGWQNRSGTLKGIPMSSFYDPASGNQEAYALSTTGDVEEDWLSAAGTWSGWLNLGGTFGASPSAVYDPLDGTLELWEVATSGTAFVRVWTPGSGWSAWQNKGGEFRSGLRAVYDPRTAKMWVFGVAKSNTTVWAGSWTTNPSSGFSGWAGLNGDITGNLSPIYDTASGNLEVYGLSTSGVVEEDWLSAAGTWSGWLNLGGTFGASPSPVYDPLDGTLEIWEVATSGTGFVRVWTPGSGWSAWQNKGGEFSSGLQAVYDSNSARMWVFGVAKSNATVWNGSFATNPASGFSGWVGMNGNLLSGDL